MIRLRFSMMSPAHLRSRALALLLGSIAALVVAEFAMRLPPVRQSNITLSNIMFTCYEPGFPERYIFARAGPISQNIHQPNLRSECSFNGYFWEHQSDGYGWRNPETWPEVDVVLLGDSMIYGHGVEEAQTVAHFLRLELSAVVANQAVMGASPIDHLAIYRNFSIPLNPKVTVMFIYANDMMDLHSRPPKLLDRFIRTGTLPQARRYDRADLLSTLTFPEVSAWQRLAGRSRLYSLLRYYVPALRARPPAREGSPMLKPLDADPAADLAGIDFQAIPSAWFGRELAFTRRVIATMARTAEAHDTVLVVAYLPGQSSFFRKNDRKMPRLLVRFSKEYGVPFFEAGGSTWDQERRGFLPGSRLPIDGHLSPLGHELLARDLARFLRQRVPALNRGSPSEQPPKSSRSRL
jgi:hypothetical protein